MVGAAFLILSIGFAAWALRHVADDNKRLRLDQAQNRTLIEQLSSALDTANKGGGPVRTSQDIVRSVRSVRTVGQDKPDNRPDSHGQRPDKPVAVSPVSFGAGGRSQVISTGPR